MIVTAEQILANVQAAPDSAPVIPADRRHGRYSTYTHGRCRCVECRAAHRRYSRDRRMRALRFGLPPGVEHGTYHAYCNLGCRCDDCKAANTAYCRAYQQRWAS